MFEIILNLLGYNKMSENYYLNIELINDELIYETNHGSRRIKIVCPANENGINDLFVRIKEINERI